MARLIPPEPIQGSQLRKNLTEIIENKIDNAILVQQTVFKNMIILSCWETIILLLSYFVIRLLMMKKLINVMLMVMILMMCRNHSVLH